MHTSVRTSLVSSANFGGSISAQTDFVSASGRLTAVDIGKSPNTDSGHLEEEQILYRLPLQLRCARIMAAHRFHYGSRPIPNLLGTSRLCDAFPQREKLPGMFQQLCSSARR